MYERPGRNPTTMTCPLPTRPLTAAGRPSWNVASTLATLFPRTCRFCFTDNTSSDSPAQFTVSSAEVAQELSGIEIRLGLLAFTILNRREVAQKIQRTIRLVALSSTGGQPQRTTG